VLIVDDNRDAAESLALLLELEGHRVRVAHDGPEALGAVAEAAPEAVLLDIGLPGDMSGYEVERRLRRDPATQKALVVAMPGYGQEEDRSRSRDAGFDAHLVKPVDPSAVRDILTQPRP
jgi:CheY-like chemotaxis protein